jgi:hypothetical protein
MKVTNGGSGTSSFVVPYLLARLKWVKKYCLLELLPNWFHLSAFWIDLYVIGHLGLAVLAYALSFWVPCTLGALVILYSAWRIIELVAFFLVQMIADEPGVASRERSFVLALSNYFEVTFWFAVWYSVFVRCGSLTITKPFPSGFAIFRESLAMMLANSSNAFEPMPSWSVWAAMCLQSVIGLFLTLVVVARTVASLPPLKRTGL